MSLKILDLGTGEVRFRSLGRDPLISYGHLTLGPKSTQRLFLRI
jgi:hypothetical protein